ncbi:MAG: hypothetical protein ACLVJH_17930 [Faecalibacterium prausnitzii]
MGIAVSCCAETVSVTAAVFSSGCAASASGAPIERSLPMPELRCRRAFTAVPRAVSLFQNVFSCCAPNLMHFYRDAALRKKGSVSSSQYSFSIHPRASPRQLPHTAKRSSEKLPPRYQKMLQNRYVSARKNIAQSQKLQIFQQNQHFVLLS